MSAERSTPSVRHGTEYGYNKQGCRCLDCKAASARARRKRRKGKGPGKTPAGLRVHGYHGYLYHGCRCDICRAGNAASHRRWYAKNRAKRRAA